MEIDRTSTDTVHRTPFEVFLEAFDGKPVNGFDSDGDGLYLFWNDTQSEPKQPFDDTCYMQLNKSCVLRMCGNTDCGMVCWKYEDTTHMLQEKLKSTVSMIGKSLISQPLQCSC